MHNDRFHKMHNNMGYEEAGEHPEVQQFMAHILKSLRYSNFIQTIGWSTDVPGFLFFFGQGFVRRSASKNEECLWRRLDVWMYKKQHVPYGLLQVEMGVNMFDVVVVTVTHLYYI